MALQTSTDVDVVRSICAAAVRRDPVANTVFGTAAFSLVEGETWCAWDGESFAMTTSAAYSPIVSAWSTVEELRTVLDPKGGVSGPRDTVERIIVDWPGARQEAQRLHRCDDLAEPSVAGQARPAIEADGARALDLFEGFRRAVDEEWDVVDALARSMHTGTLWLWIDPTGDIVSMARAQATAGGIARIGPVYTPAEQRGHGYASGVTAAATRDIRDRPALPVLFTDLANPVSNAIYARLGYRAVGDYLRVSRSSVGTKT